MTTLRFSTQQFRSIPSPAGGSESRIGFFFTKAATVPPDLFEWRDVNPREVSRGSQVYSSIRETLVNEPARFHERNRGITIVAKDLVFDDKKKEVLLTLDNKQLHGVVDGAHTLDAVLNVQKDPPDDGWPAFVFVKVFVGVDPDQIAEIAGGLNTSQQVDLKSLENLREHFSELQRVLESEPYANQIAYKMNEKKPIDVREILYYLAVFDCTEYNEKKHPVALFGRKEGIVRRFAEQAQAAEDRAKIVRAPKVHDSFSILIRHAPDILKLRDTIEEKALALPVGRYKSGKGVRVRSDTHKKNQLAFSGKSVNGKIPLGWIMPMLAGFRANVDWDEKKGTFRWTVPLDELVESCINGLVQGIQEVHQQENSRPEYVGRNALSWRLSYNTVAQAILQWQLLRAQSRTK